MRRPLPCSRRHRRHFEHGLNYHAWTPCSLPCYTQQGTANHIHMIMSIMPRWPYRTARLGTIIYACMSAEDRRGCLRSDERWLAFANRAAQGRESEARAKPLPAPALDGDETTSVERQGGRMQGPRVSHRRVMFLHGPGGVAGAEPRGAIVASRSDSCDRRLVLRLRCVLYSSRYSSRRARHRMGTAVRASERAVAGEGVGKMHTAVVGNEGCLAATPYMP